MVRFATLMLLILPIYFWSPVWARAQDAAAECNALAGMDAVRSEELDPKRAVPACEAALAEAPDNASLKLQLGRALQKADRNSLRAIALYRSAAEGGDAAAMEMLGISYASGRGMKRDFTKAREWFEKAAQSGNPEAQSLLADTYAYGRGVSRDYAKAREWYEKAAKGGYAQAMSSLGSLYMLGRGGPQDYNKARALFEEAAKAGDTHAMDKLGELYYDEHDICKAAEWYKKSAGLGNLSAAEHLANLRSYEVGAIITAGSESEASTACQSGCDNVGKLCISAVPPGTCSMNCVASWRSCRSTCNDH